MDPFRRLAAFTVARDACFVALAASTLMVAFSFLPALAFQVGAGVALAYAVVVMARAARLTDERVTRTEPWEVLPLAERPCGPAGRAQACRSLKELRLRYAKAAALVSAILSVGALLASGHDRVAAETTVAGPPHVIVTAWSR